MEVTETDAPEGDLPDVPTTKPSEFPDGTYCPPRGVYIPKVKDGAPISVAGVPQSVHNGTSRTARTTFTSETSGEVGMTVSTGLTTSINVMVAEIEAKCQVDLTWKLTAKVGVTTAVDTPPHKTTTGYYGVFRLRNVGDSYYVYNNCNKSPVKSITSYTLEGGLVAQGELMRRPRRVAHRGSMFIAAGMAALTVGGCTAGGGSTAHPTASSSPSRASQPAPTSSAASADSVTKAPTLIEGKPLLEIQASRGSQTYELEKGIAAGNLSVLVNCQGEGTLTVSLKPTGMSFPLECTAEKVLSTYNRLSLTARREHAFVDVEAPFGVKWSLTVGQ